MQKTIIIIIAFFYSICAFSQSANESTVTKVGDPVPAFSFEIEKGKKAAISDYKGKLILINLFATWCPPCRAELPLVQKEIWDIHKDNNKFALFVFGREEGWDVLEPFKKRTGFTFPILPDTERTIFSKFATQSIPRNILIDESGKIIYQSIGFEQKEFKKLVKIINKKLRD